MGIAIAILQSSYIPWRGYFNIIGMVDAFVIYDDVQYSKNHWHNRNRILIQSKPHWLTIPVHLPNGIETKIEEAKVQSPFASKHWKTISQAYAHAPFFHDYAPAVEDMYRRAEGMERLSAINELFLRDLSALLELRTEFLHSTSLGISGSKTGRLVSICRAMNARAYLSGPSAKAYLDMQQFEAANIEVRWMDYSGYGEYEQLNRFGFEPHVSILDVIFNAGKAARRLVVEKTAMT